MVDTDSGWLVKQNVPDVINVFKSTPVYSSTKPFIAPRKTEMSDILGVVNNGSGSQIPDLDEGVYSGFWMVNANTAGTKPLSNEGFVLLIIGNGDYVGQIAMGVESNRIFHRSKLNRYGHSWSAWVEIV